MFTKDCPECEGKMHLEIEDGDVIYFCDSCDNYMYMTDQEEDVWWEHTLNCSKDDVEECHEL